MTEIKKQYGIWTGIAMVVGIVIGSGVWATSDTWHDKKAD